jgi:hypothetical protein
LGLRLVPSQIGDLDANDNLDGDDVDILASKISGRSVRATWLPTAAFDLNRNGGIDSDDQRVWVNDIKQTWFGDTNLDGEFSSSDLVYAFGMGRRCLTFDRKGGGTCV